jgi:phosphoribosylformimino-5-aminoimidazole carboxamide ribotide isomerase
MGAPQVHLVDLDGAQRGVPVATDAIAAVARAVAVPLQLAGGVDGPDQIELAFAAGATRVVIPIWRVAEDDALLEACLRIASDWLAVGVDARPDRLAAYPWRSGGAPSLPELLIRLMEGGVRRVVLSHWDLAGVGSLVELCASRDVALQLAGGVTDAASLPGLARLGIDALILGEALFNGTVDYATEVRQLQVSTPAAQSGEV